MRANTIPLEERMIIALDFPTWQEAEALVDRLPQVRYFKVGLEMFLSSRGGALDVLKAKNKKIFLDLKFHDIPNTVAQACRQAVAMEADLLNVHALGGGKMMAKAQEAVLDEAARLGLTPPALIAVTLLTSMSQEDIASIGLQNQARDQVVHLARLTQDAGLAGVVASPQEIQALRQACGKDFLIVCPGVRPKGAALGDQQRVMTPGEAILAGADHLVVGRPVTQAPDPSQAAQAILQEIQDALLHLPLTQS